MGVRGDDVPHGGSKDLAASGCIHPMNARSEHALVDGQPIRTINGRPGRVGHLLGAGGQGEVYQIEMAGSPFALKWYHLHYIDADEMLRQRLERAVRRGPPTSDFLWPLDLAEVPGRAGFGYVMPLRSGSYTSIQDIIAPPPKRLELSLSLRADICRQLADNFLQLHANGFCYQDVNFGNIFIDPDTGRILICDNDNVNVDGADASIYGTRKFMAPEVVRRETLPNSRTDLFSLAVLFFYTIFGWHPLDGRREHEIQVFGAEAEQRLYGSDPLFLFDPDNDENGPVEGVHDWIVARWQAMPQRIRDLFMRSFTTGLSDPDKRVLETQWRNAFEKMLQAVHTCPDCGFEHVVDTGRSGPGGWQKCLSCDAELAYPHMLSGRDVAALLTVGREIAFPTPGNGNCPDTARVEAHPTYEDLIGLRNCGEKPWRAGLADGSSHPVPPGKSVRIEPGLEIEVGRHSYRVSQVEAHA